MPEKVLALLKKNVIFQLLVYRAKNQILLNLVFNFKVLFFFWYVQPTIQISYNLVQKKICHHFESTRTIWLKLYTFVFTSKTLKCTKFYYQTIFKDIYIKKKKLLLRVKVCFVYKNVFIFCFDARNQLELKKHIFDNPVNINKLTRRRMYITNLGEMWLHYLKLHLTWYP